MHGKQVDPAGRGDMGGGSVRAGRGAARSWERQRRTGTGLAVTALAVLGTLLVVRESRSGDVAFGKASSAEPDATDTGAGQRERAIHPVGGDKNRQHQPRLPARVVAPLSRGISISSPLAMLALGCVP